jgi:hypothetical protein
VKRQTKRVRLAAALREAMEPLMRAHGFDHPPKSLDLWDSLRPRADHWERWVGEDRQEITARWDKWNRPKFRLRWSDDAINRARGYWTVFELAPWRLGFLTPLIPGGWFGGLRPIGWTVRLAVRRTEQLLHYWEGGEPSPHLGLDRPVPHFRWPEEYDPETRGMKALDDLP